MDQGSASLGITYLATVPKIATDLETVNIKAHISGARSFLHPP